MPATTLTHAIHVPNAHLGPATAHLAQHASPMIRSRRDTVHVLHAHYGLDKLVTKPGDPGHLRMLQLLKSARLRSQLEFASTLVAQASAAEQEAAAAAAAAADMDATDPGVNKEQDSGGQGPGGARQVRAVTRPRNSLFDHLVRRDQAAAIGGAGGNHGRHVLGSNASLDGSEEHAGGSKARNRLSVYGDRRKSANASAAARKYVVPPPPAGSLADDLNEGMLDGTIDPLELDVPALHLHNTRIVVAPVTPQTREAARHATPGRTSVLTPTTNEWEPQSRRQTTSGNPKSPKEILDTVFSLWTKGHGGRSKSRRSVLPVQQVKPQQREQQQQQQDQSQLESRRKASVMRQDLTSALQKLSAPSSAASKASWTESPDKPETPRPASSPLEVPVASEPPPGKRKSVSIGLVVESAPSTDSSIPRKPHTAPATSSSSSSSSRRLSSRVSISSAGEPVRPASVSMPGKAHRPLPPVPLSTAPLPAEPKGPTTKDKPTPTVRPAKQRTGGKKAPYKAHSRQSSISVPAAKQPAQFVQEIAHARPLVTITTEPPFLPKPSIPPIAIEINVDELPHQQDEALSSLPSPSPSPFLRRRMSMFSDAGSCESISSIPPSVAAHAGKSPIKSTKSQGPIPRSPLNAAKLLAQRRGLIHSRSFASETSPVDDALSFGHSPHHHLLGSNPTSRVNSAGLAADVESLPHTMRRLSILDAFSLAQPDSASSTSSATPTGRSSARQQRRTRGIPSTLPSSAYLSLPSRAMYLIGSSSNYSHHRRRRRYRYLLSDLATPVHKARVAALTRLADRLGGGKELTAKLIHALCPPDDVLKPISGYFLGTVVNGNLNQFSAAGGGNGGPGSASSSARTARLLREVEASLAAASRRGSASDDKPTRDPFHGIKSKVRAGWNWRERRAMRKVKHLLEGTNRRKQSFYVAVARLAAGHEPKTEIPDVSVEASRRVSMVRARLGLGSELGSMVFGHVPHKVRPAVKSPDVGKPQPGRPRTGSPKRVVVGENRSLVTKYPQTRERLKMDARRLKVNVTRDSSDVLHADREAKPLSGPGLWFPGALFGQMADMGMS